MSSSPSLLLLWPGSQGAASGNFGVPQLVGLATYVRHVTGAAVAVRDLGAEKALGTNVWAMLAEGENGRPWDIIGLSCYSSYDYLLCQAIAVKIRELSPSTVVVAGGYHASARPKDILYEGSPYDACIVGEGEKPLASLVSAFADGGRSAVTGQLFGPDPIGNLDDLPLTDWSFLQRYKSIARKIASQTELYLSRGCPFDCSFCMERAKRETSWRPFSVERALEEFRRLDQFLDLSTWTVYVADALFGMRKQWRREFLEGLARSDIKTVRTWLLVRVDMIDDEDLRLFQKANCSPGFGLESGDPGQLARIRKSGRLDEYLNKMEDVSARARALDLPWGANVIVGHPGETEASMRTSAAYLKKLFLDPKGVTGFLSVDPFRLYPGSPIDDHRGEWEANTGAVFHRPEWWHDGDQEFLSEWIDPSFTLDYDRRVALTQKYFAPIVDAAPSHFSYSGDARTAAYFKRALTGQIAQFSAPNRLHYRKLRYAWGKYTGKFRAARASFATDEFLERHLREERTKTIEAARANHPLFATTPTDILRALYTIPRERFVPMDAVGASVRDVAIPLDGTGDATVSAFHAYARTFELAGISPGMCVLDLGAGTGYGTALLAQIVGPTGTVRGVEVDPNLAARGAEALAELSVHHATLVAGDAMVELPFGAWDAIVVGFTVPEEIPAAWTIPGCVTVAPVEREGRTFLTRVRCDENGTIREEQFDEVRYVRARTSMEAPAYVPEVDTDEGRPSASRAPRSLPVLKPEP